MTTKPYSKKKKQPTSIWDVVDTYNRGSAKINRPIFEPLADLGLDSWTHWPSPYNFQMHITQLACEPTWQAKVEMWSTAFGWWFWSNVVPSPVEISRKILLDSYKCGFYLPIKVKSPLNFIIGSRNTVFLAELARPLTKFAFFWWISSSIFAALDTYHTVQVLEEECQTQGFACLLGPVDANFFTDGIYEGPGMPVISDVFNRHVTASGVDVHDTVWDYNLFGWYHTGGNTFDRISISILVGTVELQTVELSGAPSFEPIYFDISCNNHSEGPTAYARIKFEGRHNPWNGIFGHVSFTRATVNGMPFAP